MFCLSAKVATNKYLHSFSVIFNIFSIHELKRLSAFRGFVIIILYKNKKYKEDTR